MPVPMLELTERYPWWSGVFNEFDGERLGLMLVHDADERFHRAPPGWALVSVERQEVTLCSVLDGFCAGADATCILGESEAYFFSRD